MKRIWSTLGISFVVLVMVAGFGLAFSPMSGQAVADKPPTDVVVVNTAEQPVPVTGAVTGVFSGDVNIVNEPTVKAKQEGAWNVGLTGTPAVRLDETGNTVKLDAAANTVEVESSEASPVYVAVTGAAAAPTKEPQTLHMYVVIPDGSTSAASEPFTVPDDKWLVIETVSAWGGVHGADQTVTAALEYEAGSPDPYLTSLQPTYYRETGAGGKDWVINPISCTLYVEPGRSVCFRVFRSDPAIENYATCVLSGYLTDQP